MRLAFRPSQEAPRSLLGPPSHPGLPTAAPVGALPSLPGGALLAIPSSSFWAGTTKLSFKFQGWAVASGAESESQNARAVVYARDSGARESSFVLQSV